MDDCSKHKKEVAGISDMKVLAAAPLHGESVFVWVRVTEKNKPELNKWMCYRLIDSNDEIHWCQLKYKGGDYYERRYPQDTVSIPESANLELLKEVPLSTLKGVGGNEDWEAVQSLQIIVDDQQKEIEVLKDENEALHQRLERLIKQLKEKESVQGNVWVKDFLEWAFKNYQWTGETWDENTGHDDFQSFTHEELYQEYLAEDKQQ